MPKGLKCIGGIADGERRIIADDQPYYVVFVRRGAKPPFDPRDRGPAIVETRAENYVVDRVLSDGEMIEFLRPADWTSLQVMRHVLT